MTCTACDKRFRKRLLPPPAVPRPPSSARAAIAPPLHEPPSRSDSNGPRTDERAPAPVPPKKEEEVIGDGTVEDTERIESLTLEDFATDFSKVRIPDKDGPLSDSEMRVAVDTFLSSLERT